MSRPTPGKDLINSMIAAITGNGGSMGVQRLETQLAWSQEDFTWVKDHLIQESVIKPGRGRGGSLQLVNPEAKAAAAASVVKVNVGAPKRRGRPAKNRQEETFKLTEDGYYEDDSTFDLDAYKARFQALPEDTKAFKPGMRVYRLPSHLYSNEKFSWRNMTQYIVDRVETERVFLTVPNDKDAHTMSAKPVRFYVKA
jgi:hypothetical protein